MWQFLKSKKKATPESDAELIALYRSTGDLKCIGELYERYAQLVYAVCMKYLKDDEAGKDAVGKIFEKLITDLKRFEVQKLSAWLHRIAYNYCMTQLELNKRKVTLPDQLMIADDITELTAHDAISDEQLLIAVQQLEEHQRRCIELFYFKEMTYLDIASKTGFTVLQVKSYLQNGKRNLKKILTANG